MSASHSSTFRLRSFITHHIASLFRRRTSAALMPEPLQSSMHRLPNELLAHIFDIIAHNDSERSFSIVACSHVCARWRHLALSTGNLWTDISFSYPLSDHQHSRNENYLQRSSTYPLDIQLDLRDSDWDWAEETHRVTWQLASRILQLIKPHIVRWRSIELLSDNWLPVFAFLWHMKDVVVAPMLENISLSRCNAYHAAQGQTFQPESLRNPLALLGGAESSTRCLRSVVIVGVHVAWEGSILRNLTTLVFKYQASDVMPSPGEFQTILCDCPQLEELAVVGWGPILDSGEHYPGGMLSLANLKRFTYGYVDIGYAIQLIPLFSIPRLDSLILEDVNKLVSPVNIRDATPLLDLLAPLQASSLSPIGLGSITSLGLHSVTSERAGYARLFSSTSSLQNMFLQDVDGALEALSMLATRDGRLLCPHLSQLFCQDIDHRVLLRALEVRTRDSSVAPFSQVTLEVPASRASHINANDLERLSDAGVEVMRVGSDSGSE